MKILSKLLSFIFLTFCLSFFASDLQAQAQLKAQKKRADKVLPLDAKVLKLNRNAAKTLAKWKTTLDFQLLPNGNFVPLRYKKPKADRKKISTAGSQNANFPLPSNNFAAGGGIDCVKIECPGTFGSGVTCWECH